MLLVLTMSFPIPQLDIKEQSVVYFGTLVDELNISVIQAFIGLTPRIRFNDLTRPDTNKQHELDSKSRLVA